MKLLDKPLGELLAEAEAISIKNGHKLNTMEASIGEIINYVEQFSTQQELFSELQARRIVGQNHENN